MAGTEELRARREAMVREHMESENEHDFARTLATFSHPRYEIIATGEVYDGEEQVAAYYDRSRSTFPDQRNRLIAMHHTDDAVIVEFELMGTQRGPLLGVPATNRAFTARLCAFFFFEGDRIVCERVYGDTFTILGQLGITTEMLTSAATP